MERKFICIVCPLGCELVAKIQDQQVVEVTGYTCPRGKMYAENECTNPQRTVTSTMMCSDGTLVAVKTDRPIPKEKMFECMSRINQEVVPLPVQVGDILLESVFGSNIVATQNKR